MGLHGMVIDLLQSVNIVTADGRLLTASGTENSDLFWAIRGAGHNFGIVTSATFTTPSLRNNGQYLNADFIFPASANRSFFEAFAAFNDDLPAELALGITVTPGVSFQSRMW
jgi:FAD/FMN-containing dehydrogenase